MGCFWLYDICALLSLPPTRNLSDSLRNELRFNWLRLLSLDNVFPLQNLYLQMSQLGLILSSAFLRFQACYKRGVFLQFDLFLLFAKNLKMYAEILVILVKDENLLKYLEFTVKRQFFYLFVWRSNRVRSLASGISLIKLLLADGQ